MTKVDKDTKAVVDIIVSRGSLMSKNDYQDFLESLHEEILIRLDASKNE